MNHPSLLPQKWNEAQRRAETYLRALRGVFGPGERELVASALASARGQSQLNQDAHPVTLVMEALFGFLPAVAAEIPAMTPPLQRATMLPEPMEFPVHDWLRRCFRRA